MYLSPWTSVERSRYFVLLAPESVHIFPSRLSSVSLSFLILPLMTHGFRCLLCCIRTDYWRGTYHWFLKDDWLPILTQVGPFSNPRPDKHRDASGTPRDSSYEISREAHVMHT